jgi:hypothetical protein
MYMMKNLKDPEMMNTEISTLIEAIKTDYLSWSSASGELSEHRKHMIETFNDSIRVEDGRKYVKIISGTSVWGFLVKGTNDKQFKQGDILKPASWATPARNKARGNILEGGYSIRWTGPNYL